MSEQEKEVEQEEVQELEVLEMIDVSPNCEVIEK